MAGLLLKNVPPDLHLKLKQRAARNRRSLSSEVLVLLEAAVEENAGPLSLEEIDRRRVRGRLPLTEEILHQARTTGRP